MSSVLRAAGGDAAGGGQGCWMAEVEVDGADISAVYEFVQRFSHPLPWDEAIGHALEAGQAKFEAGFERIELRRADSHLQTLADWLVATGIKLAGSPEAEQNEMAPVFARAATAINAALDSLRPDPEKPDG